MELQLRGRRNAHYTAELVVALEHLELVTGALHEFQVPFSGVEESRDLGLALIGLADAEGAARQLSEGLTRERHDTDLPDLTGMDLLLAGLRKHFADRYAGWAPTLGKNRLVGEVIGGGKISHGGDDPPRSTDRRLAPRPAGPGRGVTVGVLDTAIASHPWLAGGWTATADDVLVGKDGEHRPVAGHATFITGLILDKAPGCTVEVKKILDDEGEATSWDVAKAIADLGRSRLDVLNLSFLCFTEDAEAPLVMSAAVESLDRDVVVVAAAGNHGDHHDAEDQSDRKPAWPAALDHVVAVGAADATGSAATFTPRDVPWIDVLVPGEDLLSTFPRVCRPPRGKGGATTKDGFATWSGSSFAAALLSGEIAARTVPGSVPAREAWQELLRQASGTPRYLALDH